MSKNVKNEFSEEKTKQRDESRQKKEEINQRKIEEYQEQERRKEENRLRADAVSKSLSKKKQSSNLSYHIMFAVLGAVCLYVIAMMFLNQAPPLSKVPVIDDKRMEDHNNNNLWKQSANEFFEGTTLADAKKLMSSSFASHQNLGKCQIDDTVTPPESFFYKDVFGNCVLPTQDSTKACGGSYAFTVAQTIAERACIVNNSDKATPLSAQELLKCDLLNNGCKGGHLNVALDHVRSKGLVEQSCLPYNPEAEKCEGMCATPKRTRIDSYCLLIGEDDIKREILRNGPVISNSQVYVDFLTYKSGVYTKGDEVARFSGQTAVRIVGWGVESGEENEQNKGNKYWIIQTTWGKTWGEDGFAKVSFGQDLFFDQYAYAPKVRVAAAVNVDSVDAVVGEKRERRSEEDNLDLEDK